MKSWYWFVSAIAVLVVYTSIEGVYSTFQTLLQRKSPKQTTDAINTRTQQSAREINAYPSNPVADDAVLETHPNTYPTSILPSKVFTIIGLEASGTTFLSDTIRKALRLSLIGSKIKNEALGEGYSNQYLGSTVPQWTEVQHVSLPWGGMGCTQDPRQNIIPVLFPAICTKVMRERTRVATRMEEYGQGKLKGWPESVRDVVFRRYKIPSEAQEKYLNECSSKVGTDWVYPNRYSLNLTSHLDWYHENGVDVKAIIIMRDTTISRRARKFHCMNSTIFDQEEALGREILEQAMDKYLNVNGNDLDHNRRRLIHKSSDGRLVLVSYELLMQLKSNYLKVLYNQLGINSTFTPTWKDGNGKYVKEEEPPKDKARTRISASRNTPQSSAVEEGSPEDTAPARISYSRNKETGH